MKTVTAAVKEPGKGWVKQRVEDRLENWKKIVGGYIEGFYATADGIHFFCNEEGKLLGLMPNVVMAGGDVIVGPIFAVRDDGDGEFDSLMDQDLVRLGVSQ